MSRLLWFATICCVLVNANGCRKPSTDSEKDKPSNVKIEPHLQQDEPPTVLFDIKLANGLRNADFQLYDCTYLARGKTARFRLQFKQSRPMSGEIPMAPAEGKFLAIAGSDNSALLEGLKKALDAKQIPTTSPRIAELSFDAVILGEKQSRNSSGGYTGNPPGDWMLVKIFWPKGGDEGEVFLNLNPVLGKGEFSIKDSDYGDYVVGELAKVL